MITGFQLRVRKGLSEPAETIALCQEVTKLGRSKHCEIEIQISTCPLELLQIHVTSDQKIKVTKPLELDSHLFRGWCQVSQDEFELKLGSVFKLGTANTSLEFLVERGRKKDEVLCLPIRVRPGEKDSSVKSTAHAPQTPNLSGPEVKDGFTKIQKILLVLFALLILGVWGFVIYQIMN